MVPLTGTNPPTRCPARAAVLLSIVSSCAVLAVLSGVTAAEDLDDDQGFKALVADEKIVIALADFERQVQRAAWEKAFSSLDDMYAAESGDPRISARPRSDRGPFVP